MGSVDELVWGVSNSAVTPSTRGSPNIPLPNRQLQGWLERYNRRLPNRGVYMHGRTPAHTLKSSRKVELSPRPVASTGKGIPALLQRLGCLLTHVWVGVCPNGRFQGVKGGRISGAGQAHDRLLANVRASVEKRGYQDIRGRRGSRVLGLDQDTGRPYANDCSGIRECGCQGLKRGWVTGPDEVQSPACLLASMFTRVGECTYHDVQHFWVADSGPKCHPDSVAHTAIGIRETLCEGVEDVRADSSGQGHGRQRTNELSGVGR